MQWAVPFNKGDSAICLTWDKSCGLTPLEQIVVYGGNIHKNLQESTEIS